MDPGYQDKNGTGSAWKRHKSGKFLRKMTKNMNWGIPNREKNW